MLKILSSACAALMALTAPFGTAAFAMPVAAPAWAPSAVIQVQEDGRANFDPNWERNLERGQRYQRGERWDRRDERWQRRDDRWDRRDSRWDRRDGHAYWRGHRGYRDHRPGYRRHGDFWFPPAAFIAGAIIGGAIANQPPPRHHYQGNAHVEWCYARYRSYRASDNTFQPYNGPRRYCRSPYG